MATDKAAMKFPHIIGKPADFPENQLKILGSILSLCKKKTTCEEILDTTTVQNQGVSNIEVPYSTFNVFPYCINNTFLIYSCPTKDGNVQRLDHSMQHF